MSGRKRKLQKANRRQILGIVCLIVLGLLAYTLLARSEGLVTVSFQRPDGSKTRSLRVAIADTERARKRGLMQVKDLPADQGLLFIFPKEEQQSFWMANTYLPLDMIFMDTAGKVVGIIHDVPPLNTISRSVQAPSKYVLELNGGRARELNIAENSTLVFPGTLPEAKDK